MLLARLDSINNILRTLEGLCRSMAGYTAAVEKVLCTLSPVLSTPQSLAFISQFSTAFIPSEPVLTLRTTFGEQ